MKIVIALLSILFLTSCSPATVEWNEKQTVDSIYMHEVGHYSFMYADGKRLVQKDLRRYTNSTVEIIQDVPKGEKCWYLAEFSEWTSYQDFSHAPYRRLTIHIHSIDDIGTAGWNHGKFGSGQTTRIE